MSTGAKAGIGIAVFLVLVTAAIALCIYQERKERPEREELKRGVRGAAVSVRACTDWRLVGVGSRRPAFEQLSRQHGIKIAAATNVTVEECSLAVGEAVGHDSVLSASRMNSSWYSLGWDDALSRELSWFGQIMSPIKKVPLGCKSPLLKHVVSFRRHVFMILKDSADELNASFKFRIDNLDYTVFATTETMKCFGCGGDGHLIRSCPERLPGPAPRTEASGTASAEAEGDRDGEGAQETGPKSRPGAAGGERDSRGKEGDGAGCSVEEDAAQSECRTGRGRGR
ncbi:hypothetical protein MHYP_G00364080 [Metynnis hypsauchen]